jgi:hypothetical protein
MAVDKVEELRKRCRHGNKKTAKNNKMHGYAGIHDRDLTEMSDELNRISDVEVLIISAVHHLTSHVGIDAKLAEEVVGRPYANSMRIIHSKYRDDPEVSYLFAESLMVRCQQSYILISIYGINVQPFQVLNAWKLYEYPSGRSLSPDVDEIQTVLETALDSHHDHTGLCHMYIHLREMSEDPTKALSACNALRTT